MVRSPDFAADLQPQQERVLRTAGPRPVLAELPATRPQRPTAFGQWILLGFATVDPSALNPQQPNTLNLLTTDAHSAPSVLRPPPSDHSVPSCQKSFRVFRVFRGPTLRPPPSCICLPVIYPILAPFAPLCVQPSVIPPPVAFSTRTFPREKRFCQLQNNHPRPRSFVCYSPEFLRGP